MLTIANIIEEPRFGGPQNRICKIAKASSHHTVVLAPFHGEDSERFHEALVAAGIERSGLSIVRLPTRGCLPIFKYCLFFIRDVGRIASQIQKIAPDIVHISGGVSQIRSMVATTFSEVPVILHLNDTKSSFWLKCYLFIWSSRERFYICASYRTRSYYAGYARGLERRSVVIPPPV